MTTKVLLGASASVMGALGLAGSFLPHELLTAAGVAPNGLFTVLVQLHAALLFGFAMVNWMARGSLIGGIYNRPLAVGNVAHFVIGALALIKTIAAGERTLFLLTLAGLYVVFAAGFTVVLFRSPVKQAAPA